ncbi:MAG: hypothetical protein ACLP4R_06620 [Solirubrobacteraceae bacterium]
MINDYPDAAAADSAGPASEWRSDASAISSPPPWLGRRLLARVARWQAPPRNLLLSALVLLDFPWDNILIDALEANFEPAGAPVPARIS